MFDYSLNLRRLQKDSVYNTHTVTLQGNMYQELTKLLQIVHLMTSKLIMRCKIRGMPL